MFGHLGLPELLIILAIVVILFGINKLPRLGRGLGEAIHNFRESVRSPEKRDAGQDAESSDKESPDAKR